MADGIFVNGSRPKSKKEIKEFILQDPSSVEVEVTALGQEKVIPANELPIGKRFYFVGPDPYTKRNFYGQLTRLSDDLFKVS